MAAKKNAAQTATTTTKANKAQAVRDYIGANPTAKPAEISKALKDQGVEVSAGRVSSLIQRAKPRINVEQIKAAGAFVKSHGGKLSEARKAIEQVGSFVESSGSAAAALAALDAYQAVAEAVA